MSKIIPVIIINLALLSASAHAEEAKIPFLKIFTEMPQTALDSYNLSFNKNALPGWAALLSSSAILYHYDEDLYHGSQNTGRRWGLAQEDRTKTVVKMGNYDLLRLPSDKASWLYFMGDGWLDFVVAGGFFATGYFGDNARPYNTSLQIIHGMFFSGLVDQVIKRSTGRESPSDRSAPRGAWRPFTSPKKYDSNTSKYDAMPSGHVMTSTLVWTIIRTNYAEYDSVLLPAEVLWLSTLSFAMMNNGVHWASDYPLGIALGYVIGKASTHLGQPRNHPDPAKETAWNYLPGVGIDGTTTINAVKYY